jgi:heme/copper-type cytochrome/quinol oxidase subunit 4
VAGSLPFISSGISLRQTKYRYLSIPFFTVSAVITVLAAIPSLQESLLYILVVALVILNISLSVFMRHIKKHELGDNTRINA